MVTLVATAVRTVGSSFKRADKQPQKPKLIQPPGSMFLSFYGASFSVFFCNMTSVGWNEKNGASNSKIETIAGLVLDGIIIPAQINAQGVIFKGVAGHAELLSQVRELALVCWKG